MRPILEFGILGKETKILSLLAIRTSSDSFLRASNLVLLKILAGCYSTSMVTYPQQQRGVWCPIEQFLLSFPFRTDESHRFQGPSIQKEWLSVQQTLHRRH
mmetsp:Transcript_27331/g.74775  ORF Transcript_27331/g.74775 Transcript_27331/m.74775 type:complete len:101 (+) Transcript_27331:135-437(+)